MSMHAQRTHQLALLREELKVSSQDYLSHVKAGNFFSPEFKTATEAHQRSLANFKSFLVNPLKAE